MAVDWVIAPRDRALDGLEAGLREHSGAVFVGPDGVGKTSLARTAADWIGADFDRVAWVTGTNTRADPAALAERIAMAVEQLMPGAASTMRERARIRMRSTSVRTDSVVTSSRSSPTCSGVLDDGTNA